MIILQSLIEEKIAAVEQQKDDARRLNKRFTMEMNVHMAHMFQVAIEQAALPAEQRTATPSSTAKLSVWNLKNSILSLISRQ